MAEPPPGEEEPEGEEIETVTLPAATYRAVMLASLCAGTAAGLAIGGFLTASPSLLRGAGLALFASLVVAWLGKR